MGEFPLVQYTSTSDFQDGEDAADSEATPVDATGEEVSLENESSANESECSQGDGNISKAC